ncbi:MAG: hypothetical protein AAF799_19280 [Myxococcota bacterium]
MRWSDITVRTNQNRLIRGHAVRRWVKEQDNNLINDNNVRLKARLIIWVNNNKFIDDDALTYLRDRFQQLDYDPQERYRPNNVGPHRGLNRSRFNALQYPRPVYRVTLSLGDIDSLFDEVANDVRQPWRAAGVQQRLQALGYLYTPLGHTKINSHAHKCWEYYKKVHTPNNGVVPSNAAAVAKLKREIQNNQITSAHPNSGQVLGGGALPAAGNFGAIRFPGGYCFNKSAGGRGGQYTLGGGPHNAADNQYDFEIGCDRFAIEDIVRRDNPKMGRFPLLAKVERVWPDGRVTAVGNAPVHFQLLAPADPVGTAFAAPATRHTVMDYAKDPGMINGPRPNRWGVHRGLNNNEWAAVQLRATNALALPPGGAPNQRGPFVAAPIPNVPQNKQPNAHLVMQAMMNNGPPYELPNEGPKQYIDWVLAANQGNDAHDPQRDNCPHTHGGKAGQGIGDHVFETPTANEAGFHTAGRGRRDMGTLARATVSTGMGNRYAARCVANDQGYAGVVFTPSSIAGDRYRLRVYIDRPWLQTQGLSLATTVEATTGTMVVWRNIRMHRYIRKPNTTRLNYSQAVNDMFDYPHLNPLAGQNCHYFGDNAFDRMHIEAGLSDLAVLPGAQLENAYAASTRADLVGRNDKMYRPIQHQFIGFEDQLEQHYIQLIDDSPGREDMDNNEMQAALARARQVIAASGLVTTQVHWATLLFHDMTSPFLLNWRSLSEYNHLKPVNFGDLDPNDNTLVGELEAASNLAVEVVTEHFAKGGILPGLTLLQVPRGESWDHRALAGPANITSGYGIPCRTAIVSHTEDVYRQEFFIYAATSNGIHELGHVLTLSHQPPTPGGPAELHQVQPDPAFTTPQAGECACVMSYMGCYGEYCGRCGLSLRGWHVQSPTHNTGV